jgi:hypothetical protein
MISMLCKNRREGFGALSVFHYGVLWEPALTRLGPTSQLYSNVTTSCFNDVILVPLSAWIYFLLLAALFLTRRRSHGLGYTKGDNGRHRRCGICKDILYALALFCAFVMTVLEVARLILADLGVGLLPFVWPAFIIAGILRFSHGLRGKFPTYWIAGVVLWLLLIVTNAVKMAEMVKEGAGTRKGTKYPMSDEITDVGVYMGVYLVLMFAEVWR